MKFRCNKSRSFGEKEWTGTIELISHTPDQCEAIITARGSYFHVIAGKYQNGHFLCVPNHGLGCELSHFSDIFWNRERIQQQLDSSVDAESLACGIKALAELS